MRAHCAKRRGATQVDRESWVVDRLRVCGRQRGNPGRGVACGLRANGNSMMDAAGATAAVRPW